MSDQKLPKIQQPLFKNTIQKHEVAYHMKNYKRKLYQIQNSKSKFIVNPQRMNLTYRELFDQNPKKNYMFETKYLQIERENRFLFEKIQKIHRCPRKQQKSEERMKSLNITMRKKQVSQIQIANTKIFERIQKQKPSISFKQIDKEYLKTRKLSQKLSKIQKYKLQDWY